MTPRNLESRTGRKPGIGTRLLARFIGRVLQGRAAIRIVDWTNTAVVAGQGAPAITVHIKDPGVVRQMLFSPSLALGEGYMNGRIEVAGGDIFDLVDLLLKTTHDGNRTASGWREALRRRSRPLRRLNTFVRSRFNVKYHYDDKSELWDMFLDSYRQYTCGYFHDGAESIDKAQIDKMDHIARKLLLKPGHRVLDIGSGWGGLAVHLAKSYGVNVEGITLSEDQLAFAQAYAERNGVADRVKFRIQDYRKLDRSYDRIVAVGMLEHVGVAYYLKYFKTIARSLERDGVALVHVIGRPTPPGANEPFINKYIFPGSHAPALSEVVAPIERSGLFLTDVEIWRLHYVNTLRAWREKFYESWERAKELYGETFCRMWEYYLASCEAAFKRGLLEVFQFQLSRQFAEVPMTRDYLYPVPQAETAAGRFSLEKRAG